jgi:hypothetical protein
VLASGEEEDSIRVFVYAVEKSGGRVCCQVDVDKANSLLVVMGKSRDAELATFVLKYI